MPNASALTAVASSGTRPVPWVTVLAIQRAPQSPLDCIQDLSSLERQAGPDQVPPTGPKTVPSYGYPRWQRSV